MQFDVLLSVIGGFVTVVVVSDVAAFVWFPNISRKLLVLQQKPQSRLLILPSTPSIGLPHRPRIDQSVD
jgi:hypothetical protein